MITGIGGIFFKAQNLGELRTWYGEHLGIPLGEEGFITFQWADDSPHGTTTLAIFPADTDYFSAGHGQFMLNFRVDDLDVVLNRLRALGDAVDDHVSEDANGKFGWVVDPEGNRIELWQPNSDS